MDAVTPEKMKSTNENLSRYAEPALARWLIQAAEHRSDLTYGEAMRRLEREVGFASIGRATRLGYPAGGLMERMQQVDPKAPLLNVLLVLQDDRMPSDGARTFLANKFNKPSLAKDNSRWKHPKKWRRAFERAATEVYAYQGWRDLFEKTFGEPFDVEDTSQSPYDLRSGTEQDGNTLGRGGEGENHKALRLWVTEHPSKVSRSLEGARTATEVVLKSADRVDVMAYLDRETVAIEVKSRDSNDVDLERGIYQCVKYRAVLQAMDPRGDAEVLSILVTETKLPGYLNELAKLLDVKTVVVSPSRSGK